MTIQASHHLEWAKQLNEEIKNDSSDWFHPYGHRPGEPGTTGDFNYGRMRFVNRNLNYFYFQNMLSLALKNNYDFNPHYPKMLNFCNEVRNIANESGPLGRMCIWKMVPNGFLLPHVDNWKYHNQIRRYIFCISEHQGTDAVIKINDNVVEVKQGLLFQFNPAYEKHEFVNCTDRDWYFLGFDFWDIDKLNNSSEFESIDQNTKIEYENKFGGYNTKAMYMSKE